MAWIIGLPNAVRVTLRFTYFDTEGDWDFVYVYSCGGPTCPDPVLLVRLSGNTLPADVTSNTSFIKIVWQSDEIYTYTGWRAEWTALVAPNGAIRSTHRTLLQDANGVPAGRKDHGFAACQDKLYVSGGIGEAGWITFLVYQNVMLFPLTQC